MFEVIKNIFNRPAAEVASVIAAHPLMTDSVVCPYCASKNVVKRGWRIKKLENVQLLQCNDCGKTFTPHAVRGKHYPLSTIFDAISLYNLGYSLEESCKRVNQKRTPVSGSSLNVGFDVPTLDNRGHTLTENGQFVKSKSMAEGGGHDPQLGMNQAATVIKRAPVLPNSPSNHKDSISINPSTLSNWIEQFKDNLPFSRMRDFATQKFKPQDMIITATLAHRQLYRFRFHRAKCGLIMQENFHHRLFTPLVEFLEMVPGECPHQYFSAGLRASEAPLTFSKTAMIVRGKTNFATKTAAFVLQGAKERKNRHEILQKFMLYNDSVTVATEVPVYLTKDDLEHFQTQLGFEIYDKNQLSVLSCQLSDTGRPVNQFSVNESTHDLTVGVSSFVAQRKSSIHLPANAGSIVRQNKTDNRIELPKLITGHIDILQIRNGQIHILDYKPNAEKERPIEQLTLYAMALSRLTGLRLFEFKCGWFDEKDYFEFFPLHVLHKPKKARRRRKVETQEGTYAVNKEADKIKNVRPM